MLVIFQVLYVNYVKNPSSHTCIISPVGFLYLYVLTHRYLKIIFSKSLRMKQGQFTVHKNLGSLPWETIIKQNVKGCISGKKKVIPSGRSEI